MSKKSSNNGVGRVAHKTLIHLNDRQSSWMRDNCVASRFAYNYAVAFIRDAYWFASPMEIRKWWSYERDNLYPWMSERKLVMAGINDTINVNFAAALSRWRSAKWAATSAPKFHKRHSKLSVTWSYNTISNKNISRKTLTLPRKIGTARLAEQPRYVGKIMQTTFSFEGGKWYVSFLIAADPERQESAPIGTSVGVDVGVVNFASLSNGEQFAPSMNYSDELKKLANLQRQLSKMQCPIRGKRKSSKNWQKQSDKVNAQYRHIANVRRNYSEHVSKDIAERFETVVIENLKIKNMSASAKGDAENHGKNVSQKSGLNRSILNGGFFQFRTRLEAKVAARGGTVIAVNPAYTSQTCPVCGHVSKENRPSQAVFKCVQCGHEGHADVIAAQNILTKGLIHSQI